MILNGIKSRMTLPLALFLMSGPLYAAPSNLEEFYKQFKAGRYSNAILELEKLSSEENSSSSKAYLSGLVYARMQEFDRASIQFAKAIAEKNESVDLYYEYGQSLYAANELKKAREAFKISIKKGYNTSASLYYVAHISQILEEYDTAREAYLQVLKDKTSDNKMKQIANFQLAETLLSIAREKSKENDDLERRVDKFIIPMMQKAYALDKSSAVSIDINNRLNEIMREFNLDPNMLANGRRINPKRYSGYVSQKVKFDDNISLTSEENNVQQSKKESFIFETEAYAKYDIIAKKRFIISPETRFTYIEHSDQSSPEVYQNDSFVMNFNLKNKYEHKVKEQPASLIFDIDFARTLKDWKAEKKREFYSNSTTFTIGESFSYFEMGDTTLKLKRKNYDGADDQIDNHTTTFSADQTLFLPIQHLLIGLFEANFIDNYNNPSTNTNTYLFRLDYMIPEIMPQYTLGLAFATTITDTKEQKATRGTETSLNPSVDLAKDLSDHSRISINFDFTKNNSDDSNYAYSKSVFTTEYRYSF